MIITMTQPLTMLQIDAFTAAPFAGNPAAVCFLDHERHPSWMQSVAAEMNLSETAFLLPEGDGYRLRWFTPAAEVRLCGHATLASAHALWETGRLPLDATARFYTLSGLLTAQRCADWIELNFPARPPEPVEVPGLAEALAVIPLALYKDADDYMVVVATEAEVRLLNPDIPAIKELPVRGVIVTARSTTDGLDFISRFFAPRVGVNEDPVTGSAHCCLTPYWAGVLNKNELIAYQASKRGGVIHVRLEGDRVVLAGQAVTVFSAQWFSA
jgi:PhzF family phenazine biosynthesis protein